ncbi:MAG: DNA polymerase Y family protein [Betaproteobacteria bacterium]|nr:DNA polymerase Y family protein [Betaproteobacteria bacterium]MDE2480193.1 DNA polymerase Y family protein [Betaproteobacteria bacterium]
MLWVALLACAWPEPAAPVAASAAAEASAHALAVWGLQFTPRVVLLEHAVLLELERSLRLFGGLQALRRRIDAESAELGATGRAWAATALGALALARAAAEPTPPRELERALDALPLHSLEAAAAQAALLQHLGCRCLGDVRRLPREGLARRCGPRLLQQLDQAYGLRAEQHAWFALPQAFRARLELPARVEDAQALLFGARRLLLQLEGWLGARQAGATALLLRWRFDTPRLGDGRGELAVRTALPLRGTEQLARLLAEHLGHVSLAAPVIELELELQDMQPLAGVTASLLPAASAQDAGTARELVLALQRVAARLGPRKVLQGSVVADHRPEWQQAWHAFGEAPRCASAAPAGAAGPRPSFLLPRPLPLRSRGGQPLWQGELRLLLGPQRIEGGWWQRDEAGGTHHVARDYWVAANERSGLLWVFRSRERETRARWFLHGVF